jgi:hypothetical protein
MPWIHPEGNWCGFLNCCVKSRNGPRAQCGQLRFAGRSRSDGTPWESPDPANSGHECVTNAIRPPSALIEIASCAKLVLPDYPQCRSPV